REQLAPLFSGGTASARVVETKRGDRVHVVTAVASMLDARNKIAGRVLVIHDLTERMQLSDQLALDDRMASLGRMAMSIAHEINNPLAFIISNIEYTNGELRPLAAELEQIVNRFGGALTPKRNGLLGTLAEMNEAMTDARDGTQRLRQIVDDLRS